MNQMAVTIIRTMHTFEFGTVTGQKEGRDIGLHLAVKIAEHFESWDGLIAATPETLQAWVVWLKDQQHAFAIGKKLGSFQLMGISFEAEVLRGDTGRELYLKMPTQQLVFIKGLRWEGNPMKWPNWSAPLKVVRGSLEKALANKASLIELAVSHRAQPTEVIPHFDVKTLR
jgi:hypothetical protein